MEPPAGSRCRQFFRCRWKGVVQPDGGHRL
jgi:hypothetical protein